MRRIVEGRTQKLILSTKVANLKAMLDLKISCMNLFPYLNVVLHLNTGPFVGRAKKQAEVKREAAFVRPVPQTEGPISVAKVAEETPLQTPSTKSAASTSEEMGGKVESSKDEKGPLHDKAEQAKHLSQTPAPLPPAPTGPSFGREVGGVESEPASQIPHAKPVAPIKGSEGEEKAVESGPAPQAPHAKIITFVKDFIRGKPPVQVTRSGGAEEGESESRPASQTSEKDKDKDKK